MKAIQIQNPGGPEVMSFDEVAVPQPGPGEALVKVAAAGVNFIDIYHRSGQYKVAQLPHVLGSEAAGIIEAVGPGVTEVRVGDRVASSALPHAYAQYAVGPVAKLVPVPDGIDLRVAAAVMLQGMTAHYLSHSTYPIESGDVCLIHAAAGGVGLLLTQMAKMRGARVIGTVSSNEKAQLARDAGADELIDYSQTDFAAETRRLTGGQGVAVVYDSVGKDTFTGSLDSLRKRGYLVLFGQSSGAVPAFDLQVLNTKGSLFVTRPTLFDYTLDRAELLSRAEALFGWIASGDLNVRIDHAYPLADASQAHTALSSRKTSGKVLLIP